MARIYVSSTFKDLEECRDKVIMALSKMGHVVMSMEYYVTENDIPFDNLLEDIASCDLYIGIFAWTYGHVPDGYDKSIIELEYRKAVEKGKECLIFLLHKDAPWPPNFVDKGKDAEKIKALRNELFNKYALNYFTSADELAGLVRMAVYNWETKIKTKTPTANPSFEKSPFKFAVPGFASDIRAEQDLVGIGAEIDAFAYLIAAKTLQPPMAIGLFGNWGSGKSFFMEALRKRIHTITADAQQSGQPQKKISIYKYIAQIEFNAWHYVEEELWASLVEHIFRNLKTRSGDGATLLQERRQAVIKELEIERRAQEEAQDRKGALEKELDKAHKRVEELGKEYNDALKELNNLKAREVLKAIKLSDKEKDVINQTLEDLGVMGPKTKETNETNEEKLNETNAAEMIQDVNKLRTVLEKGNSLTTPMRERGWKWTVTLIIVILIGPVISLALSKIDDFSPITNALMSLSAFLSGLAVMLKQGTIWLSNAQTRVESIHIQLDAKRSEVESQFCTEIAEKQRQYNEKMAEYDQAKRNEKKTKYKIFKLEQELQQITPERLLLDFIDERIGSQDYRKHLGIAALIRNDFEQLSQLIAERNKEFDEKDDGTTRKEDQHLINRIVLYIDDLDRCPPDRVVQVLQAVHLLLAFPLFVVVVAVDARWLSQSLQAHYQNLLSNSTLQDDFELSKSLGSKASPQDYLEKIFQIPFWVRPLPEKARNRIVKGLVLENLSSSVKEKDNKKKPDGGQNGMRDNSDAKIEKKRAVHWEDSERRRSLNLGAKTDLEPQTLKIEEIELQFMDELCSLLGQTPRSVKRFVNIYRLIKAISLNQKEKFVEDRPDANFKLVLFLLAVNTGLSAISREFFRQLRMGRSEIAQVQNPNHLVVPARFTLAQVLEKLHVIVLRAPQTLLKDSFIDEQDASFTLENSRTDTAHGYGYKDWDMYRDLKCLESWLIQYENGSWLSFDATALADWASQIVRFSYQIEEL